MLSSIGLHLFSAFNTTVFNKTEPIKFYFIIYDRILLLGVQFCNNPLATFFTDYIYGCNRFMLAQHCSPLFPSTLRHWIQKSKENNKKIKSEKSLDSLCRKAAAAADGDVQSLRDRCLWVSESRVCLFVCFFKICWKMHFTFHFIFISSKYAH